MADPLLGVDEIDTPIDDYLSLHAEIFRRFPERSSGRSFGIQWSGWRYFVKYAEAFVANDIDMSVLPDLTESDLERLGVSLGHGKKLLRAIAALPAPVRDPTVAPAVGATGRLGDDLVDHREAGEVLGGELELAGGVGRL